VLLDISMPVLNGFEAAEKIAEVKPSVKIIMVTSHAAPAYVEEAFLRGARGYVVKGRSADLFDAIRTVLAGRFYRPQFGR
jgi:DNA-binding NarL/FixJ family response regulator